MTSLFETGPDVRMKIKSSCSPLEIMKEKLSCKV